APARRTAGYGGHGEYQPAADRTAGLFGRRASGLIRPVLILVNTARGLVNDADLCDAPARGRPAAARLDVPASEPPARDNPLLRPSNVVFSPRTAGADASAYDERPGTPPRSRSTSAMKSGPEGAWPTRGVRHPRGAGGAVGRHGNLVALFSAPVPPASTPEHLLFYK